MSLLLQGAGPSSSSSSINTAINTAFTAKGFNRNYADTFAAWYVTKNASLSGVVQDETPNRDTTRSELTCNATSFTTNQRFSAGSVVTGTSKTALSAFIWVNPSTLAGDKSIIGEFNTTAQRGWFIQFDGTSLRVIVSADGGIVNAKSYVTTATFSTGTWYHVGFAFAAGVLTVYINGKSAAVTKTVDGTVSTIHDSTQVLEIGSNNGGANYLEGSAAHPYVEESALTAAQVRDLYLDDLANVPVPDHAWILDGDNAWTIAGSSVLSPSNTPTRSESEDNPKSGTDFNFAGYGTTIYKNDWSAGADGWRTTIPSSYQIVDFEGKENVWKHIAGNDGAGTATSDRSEKSISLLTEDGESYTLKFDLFIPSSNTSLDQIRFASSVLSPATVTPAQDTWESFELTGLTAANSNTYLRFYPYNGSFTIPTGDVFYLANVEIISETKSAGWFPAQWGSNTTASNGYPLTFTGQVARNGQLENGPCILLDGVNQYGVITNTDDYSGEDWVLKCRFVVNSLVGIKNVFSQDDGGGTGRGWLYRDSGTLRTAIGGAVQTFSNPLSAAKEYYVELEKSSTTLTLRTTNLTDGLDVQTDSVTATMESAGGNLNLGVNKIGTYLFDGKMWGIELDCTTDPTKSFNCPISDEKGTISKDISGNSKDIAWQNSPSLSGDQDSYFHGEAYGCNSVPIFVDGVELTNGLVDYDGLKSSILEVDFVPADTGTQTIFTNGSLSPIRLRQTGGNLQFSVRASGNTSVNYTVATATVDELMQVRIEVAEHETNPTTESSIVVTNRITGEVLYTNTAADIAISSATSNSGLQQIGNYTSALQTFTGDLYRVKHWAGGILVCDWNSDDYLNNAVTGVSNFSETGGTLDIKKIPALAAGTNDANGYPIQNTSSSHKDTQATLRGYLANSDSEADIYFGAEFAGSSPAIIDSSFEADFDGWTSQGNAKFTRQTDQAYDGSVSLRSSPLDQSSSRWGAIYRTVTLAEDTTLTFRRRRNTDAWYGYMAVYLNTATGPVTNGLAWYSGPNNNNTFGAANTWLLGSVTIPAGTNTIYIGYRCDSDNSGTPYYWLDDVQLGTPTVGTSSIRLTDDFNWHQSWSLVAKMKPSNISGTKNLFHSTSANYGIKIVDDDIVVRLNGTDHTFSDVPLTLAESDVSIEFAGGDAADITVTVDSVSQTITGPTIGTNTSIPWIGASNVPDNHYSGMLRGVVITNNGASYYDSPLYKDSLDRSAQVNHGTETDITYLNNPATEIAALNPAIAGTETLAVTEGNKKLILLGAK